MNGEEIPALRDAGGDDWDGISLGIVTRGHWSSPTTTAPSPMRKTGAVTRSLPRSRPTAPATTRGGSPSHAGRRTGNPHRS